MPMIENNRTISLRFRTSDPSSIKFDIGKVPYGPSSYIMHDSSGNVTAVTADCVTSMITFEFPYNFWLNKNTKLRAISDKTNGTLCAVIYPESSAQSEFICDYDLRFLNKEDIFQLNDEPHLTPINAKGVDIPLKVMLMVADHNTGEVLDYQATFTITEQVKT